MRPDAQGVAIYLRYSPKPTFFFYVNTDMRSGGTERRRGGGSQNPRYLHTRPQMRALVESYFLSTGDSMILFT